MAPSNADLQLLIDDHDIRRLLSLYPRALDRKDYKLLGSLFHSDASVEYGIFTGPVQDFVELMRVTSIDGRFWMHHNGTQIIDIDGTLARAETYGLAFLRQDDPTPSGSGHEIMLRVRYLDRVEKRAGRWKIAHRRVVWSPSQIMTFPGGFPTPEGTLWESGEDDPVFNWPSAMPRHAGINVFDAPAQGRRPEPLAP